MYSACKLNKHSDNKQPWCIPFPIWNQSIVPCLFIIVASWPAYRFLRRQVCSVQFSRSVMSDSLQPHELQHARPPCPSPTPGVHSNSHPLSQWCLSMTSSSANPFSSHLRFFSASGSFLMSWLFTSGGQGIGASSLATILPKNIQDWFPLGLTGLISLQSKSLKSLLQHYNSKASILWCSAFFMIQLSHSYMNTGKTIDLTMWTFVGKMISLIFNTLSRFIVAFLPRSKYLWIS